MLTDTECVRLREGLERERNRLLRNAADGLALSMERDQDTIGRDSIDESMAENLLATELRLRDREKWLLGKIDNALERLQSGAIDECEDCGEAIGFKRLLARPVTTMCIECKETREREESAFETTGTRGILGAGAGFEEDPARTGVVDE